MKSKRNKATKENESETLSSPVKNDFGNQYSRRWFLHSIGLGTAALGLSQAGCSSSKKAGKESTNAPEIQGFETVEEKAEEVKEWKPVSDRKVKVGIVGYGYCRFGAHFGFQDHPNVEIVAVSDLFPDRCAALAKECRVNKTYPSLEELVKDKDIEAVFIATDAPSHARHAMEALNHGKHVAVAVPATFGSIEEGEQLLNTVKRSGLKYMMFETSYFRARLYAMRQIFKAGKFGKLVYSEGEYYHYHTAPLPGYKDWRFGLPPQWYPTHSNAYHIGVTDETFTEVSCMGVPSLMPSLQPGANRYNNRFFSEFALFRASGGGSSRMVVSWDTPGGIGRGEDGRVRGQKGSYFEKYEGIEKIQVDIGRPGLPPGVPAGGHGGSHGRLTDEFITSILTDRKPLIDIATALNLTVPGIIAHQSALKDGELLKIPQYYL